MHRFKDRLANGQLCRIFASAASFIPLCSTCTAWSGAITASGSTRSIRGSPTSRSAWRPVPGGPTGMDWFVRMAMTNYADATANLEAGAGGLMAARMESAAHAEEFLQWVKFAPRGNRGLNASGYDCLYGGKTLPQFAADANRDNFVAIQIETLGALEECEKIAAIDGVDLLFVGPSDLSQVLGVLAQWESDKLWSGHRTRRRRLQKARQELGHDRRQSEIRRSGPTTPAAACSASAWTSSCSGADWKRREGRLRRCLRRRIVSGDWPRKRSFDRRVGRY